MQYLVEFGAGSAKKQFIVDGRSSGEAFEIAFEKYLLKNPTEHAYKAMATNWWTIACNSEELYCRVAPVSSDGFIVDAIRVGGLRENSDLFDFASRIMRAHGIDIAKIETELKKEKQDAVDWEWRVT